MGPSEAKEPRTSHNSIFQNMPDFFIRLGVGGRKKKNSIINMESRHPSILTDGKKEEKKSQPHQICSNYFGRYQRPQHYLIIFAQCMYVCVCMCVGVGSPRLVTDSSCLDSEAREISDYWLDGTLIDLRRCYPPFSAWSLLPLSTLPTPSCGKSRSPLRYSPTNFHGASKSCRHLKLIMHGRPPPERLLGRIRRSPRCLSRVLLLESLGHNERAFSPSTETSTEPFVLIRAMPVLQPYGMSTRLPVFRLERAWH